ncbi:hypothetical protein BLEM_1053 [Bifidobacterium lemurum]|uniref:Uncharacterized protein n=1 Tax=Bifidobacterium lemurum TaxID=1603886 RepID=A0A261FTM3_9BIFI|nr:hypothetical protein [Bifidobacterium lemurum]OZG62507.1 hypothetical protein BLEM_1053 [Bifidobacterium lemurum]QOL33844.1 hypothetical protein BL8807_08705 [Bifidobacterium lemurum]
MRYGKQDELISEADIEELFANPVMPASFDRLVAPRPLPKRPLKWPVFVVPAAIVVIAALVFVMVVRPFSSVRAAHYAQASQLTSTMSESYVETSTAFTNAYSFLYSNEIDPTTVDATELTSTVKTFDEQVDDFADARAMSDQDVASAYANFQRQAKQYVKLMNALADSAGTLAQSSAVCVETPTVAEGDSDYYEQYETYIANCRSNVEALTQSEASVLQEYASTTVQNLDQMTSIINQMRTIGDFSTATSAEYQELSALADQLIDLDTGYGALNDFQVDLQQAVENVNPMEMLQELNTLLGDKYQEKSA